MLLEEGCEIDVPVGQPGVHAVGGPAQINLFDDGAGIAQSRSTGFHIGRDLVIDMIDAQIHVQSDAQALHVARDGALDVDRCRVRHDVTLKRALGNVQEQGGIVDCARQGAEVADVVEHGGEYGHGDAPQARFQAHGAAERSGDAHGPAHVGAFGQRHAA